MNFKQHLLQNFVSPSYSRASLVTLFGIHFYLNPVGIMNLYKYFQ